MTVFQVSLKNSSTKYVPSSVEATFQIDSISKGAAVLQCGLITKTGIGNIDSRIKDWGKNNKERVFKEAKDAKRLGGFLVVTAVYKAKWCRTRCWSSTSLKSYARLKVGGDDDDDTTLGEASFKMSTETEDKSGVSFPAGKAWPRN